MILSDGRRFFGSLCGLVIQAAILASPGFITAADTPDRTVAIALPADAPPHRIEQGEIAALPAKTPVWLWSSQCAPARFVTPLSLPEPCEAGAEFAVRVLGEDRRPRKGVPVLWGTPEMLREIPEKLLPSARTDEKGFATIRAPGDGVVRVRAAGEQAATTWRDLQDGLVLVGRPGRELVLEVAGVGGSRERFFLQLDERGATRRAKCLARLYDTAPLVVPPYPAGLPVQLQLWGERSAPRVFAGTLGELPDRVSLDPGATIRGKLTDERGRPVAAARVEAMVRIPGVQRALRRTASATPDGAFVLGGLPPGRCVLTVQGPGWIPLRHNLELRKGDAVDLSFVMQKGRTVVLEVRDDQGNSVAGATAEVLEGVPAGTTGADGRLVLRNMPRAPFTLSIHARGFLSQDVSIPRVVEGPVTVALPRAASLKAVFVSSDTGEPAGGGTVERVREDGGATTIERERLPANGRLEIEGIVPGRWTIIVRPAGAVPLRFDHLQLPGGRSTDLGIVPVHRGLTIQGTVLDDVTGEPLEGARITLLLPDAMGNRFAAFQEQWRKVISDGQGRFQILGLQPGTFPLLVEAVDRAPVLIERIELTGDEPEGTLDLDPIWLGEPHRLDVRCEPAERCGETATVLLGSPVNDWAAVSAPLRDGDATIGPLGAGEYRLKLTDRGFVVTQRLVEIDRNEPRQRVEISLEGTLVTGTVFLGEEPAHSGHVSLSPGTGDGMPDVISNTRMPGEDVPEQEILTGRGRTLTARVGPDGRFEIKDVAPGEYTATFSGEGWRSPERSADIPEGDRFEMILHFGGGRLTGTVTTEDGTAPEWAVATVTDGEGNRSSVPCDRSGVFTVAGLKPGPATVHVEAAEGVGRVDTRIEPDEETAVEIQLEKREATLEVAVAAENGTPFPGARVAVGSAGGLDVQTTDSEGIARFTSPDTGRPGSSIVAWAPGRGLGFSTVPAGTETTPLVPVTITNGPGRLVVLGTEAMLPVHITTPAGVALDRFLPLLLGIPPAAAREMPLVLDGLPPGRYTVALGRTAARTVSIEPGETATVDFEE